MNFDVTNIFGSGFAEISLLEELEQSWRRLAESPSVSDEEYWKAVSQSYDLLFPVSEEDAVPKELMGLYTVAHDFAVSDRAKKEKPLWAAVAEALSGLAAYSLTDIPIEGKRSLRAFTDDAEYIIDIDSKSIISE